MHAMDKSSVTVIKLTLWRLNALSVLRNGVTLDRVIDSVLEEYLQTGLSKEEKKKFDLLVEVFKQKDKKF